MPHGRVLARSENLDTGLIVLAQGDNDFPTQNTVPQHGGRGRQSAQGVIQRDDLGFRRAVRHSCLLLGSSGEHEAGVRAH
eukprot:615421-Alexandrium_andersonii.AAC.1